MRVIDTGIGMTPEDLKSAFEPFFRAETGRDMSVDMGGIIYR
ncbi:MAG: hypothetical protein CM1200mP24_01940 [Gammaproteobacteria bacterium]|nr:MAG: hypothetical protein CM1200mP24_01940 [Gammaproteobacteria bacterium]